MALLGHVARLVLHVDDTAEVLGTLTTVGFDPTDDSRYGQRMTDGQLLLVVCGGPAAAPSLLYAAPSLQSVADRLTAAGIAFGGSMQTELSIDGPGQLRIRVVSASSEDMEERSGIDNEILGFLDSIVVPVDDVAVAADWAQKCGFFILDASNIGAPMTDVTDGLLKLSFRKQDVRAPYLHYTADIDEDWSRDLAREMPEARVVASPDEGVSLVHLNINGALQIMITQDEF